MKPKLTNDESQEIDDLLSEALNGSRTADDASAQRFLGQVAKADRAGRDWPDKLRELALWEWARDRQKDIAKRESVVMIDHNGRKVGKATRVGKRVKRVDGTKSFQQSLISDMSWTELFDWGSLIAAQMEGLRPNLTIVQRLRSLYEQMPDTAGPAEACKRLGVTVEDYLAAESA